MNSSTFRNPHGLPNSEQTSTARDFVKLAIALQERFPTYYKYFSARSFTYKGVRHRNHNRLLGSVQGVDGIKTGYTRASGFNLVSNVRRDGRHIVAVVMGGRTASSRDAHMRELISKYLPAAKRGSGGDLLVAEAPAGAGSTPAVEVQMPRPRPGAAATVLAYAGNTSPRDVVAAAMELPAAASPPVPHTERTSDPIAERISGATEIAELAYVQSSRTGGRDAIARLTAMAKLRAGGQSTAAAQEIVAAPRSSAAEDRSAASGWHIQIGAVPTRDGANELIQEARASIGAALASLEPLTQPVEKDGTTLYRARFAGLSDKEAARALCAKLESKSFSCLAVQN
jgi:D-alanyl-D-alanine carboxypeptidase